MQSEEVETMEQNEGTNQQPPNFTRGQSEDNTHSNPSATTPATPA